jgi:catechol 2,3-dioxygenase
MGHVHLKVATIAEPVAFYDGVLGFALMAQLGGSAAFLSAGGYHHHLGANTWESAGAPAPPSGTAALRHATILIPDQAERERILGRIEDLGHAIEEAPEGPQVRDPSGNRLVFALQ